MSRRLIPVIALVAIITGLLVPSLAVAADGAKHLDVTLKAPKTASSDVTFGLTLTLPSEVAAFDGRVLFKGGSAEVVGLAMPGKGTAMRPEESDGGYAVGAYELESDSDSTRVDVVIAAAKPGNLQVRIVLDTAADRDGNTVALETTELLAKVRIDGGKADLKAPAAAAREKAERAPRKIKDVYQDGTFDQKDVDAARAQWITARATGNVCLADAAGDANGDGCIDAMDLQGLASKKGEKSTAATGSVTFASYSSSESQEAAAALAPVRTFTVTSALDTPDAAPGNGACADSQGRCTLRAAITESGWLAGEDLIAFNIPLAAPVRIQLGSALPIIGASHGGVIIDGYTQPGSRPNTATFASNAVPGIEIRGNGNSAREMALFITSGNNVVRGLIFGNVWRGIFIDGPNAAANSIVGNWIGFTPLQANAGGQYGIVLNVGAHHNVIGTPALADRNVFGNWGAGIDAYGAGSDFNVIQNNMFCIRPDGQGTSTCSSAIDHNFGPKNELFGGFGTNERNVMGPSNLQCIEYSHGYNPNAPAGTDFSIQYQINNNRALGNWAGFRHDGTYNSAYRCGLSFSTSDNGQAINVYDGTNDNVIEGNYVGSAWDGIQTMAPTAQRNIIRNNIIGESPNGQAAPLNRWGVVIRWGSKFSVVENNTIRNAGGGGIGLVDRGSAGQLMSLPYNIKISRNVITNTNGPAIDLFGIAGPDANDPGDGDDGANTLLNTPVLTSVTTTRVDGTAQAGSTVEVFEASRPAGQFGLPIAYLGAATAAANGTWTVPVAIDVGDRVSAVQIRPDLNTSEMSVNVAATAGAPNTPPVVDAVSITPGSPSTNQTLTATVTSHDADGDPLTTAYQWTRNGTDISGATASTLNLATAGNGDRGDLIRVRVTVSDGPATSTPVTSNPVTVANTAPSATVALTPASPQTDGTLTATATKADADADPVSLTYVWTVNGVTRQTTTSASALTDTFNLSAAGNGDAGDTVTVTVTPNDGTANGASATDSETVVGGPTVYAIDTFTRTVPNGWGSATTGGAYTLFGTAADFDTTGSTGTMTMAAGANRAATLGVSARDVDVSFRLATDKTAAGGSQYIYGIARRVSSTTEYRAKLRFATNGQAFVQASAVVNNVETGIGSEVLIPGVTQTANSFLWVRAQFVGANPTTIRIRVWADGTSEPSTWNYTATNSVATLQANGGVGLRVYMGGATSNAPVVVSFDDLRATSATP